MEHRKLENDPTGVVRHILLAEDDEAFRALLRWSLEMRGYEVTESANGLELLEQLECFVLDVDDPLFELIISDVRMPGLTGMEILTALASCKKLPPFVVITAFGSPELHEDARRSGAAAILDKPFDVSELVAVIERLVPTPHPTAA